MYASVISFLHEIFTEVNATVSFLDAGHSCEQNKVPAILELKRYWGFNNKQARTFVIF